MAHHVPLRQIERCVAKPLLLILACSDSSLYVSGESSIEYEREVMALSTAPFVELCLKNQPPTPLSSSPSGLKFHEVS